MEFLEENENLVEKITELIVAKKYQTVKETLSEMLPPDIAELLHEIQNDVNKEDFLIAFRLLSKELAADVFVEMDSDTQELLIQAFSDKELEEVLQNIFLDDTVDIIEEMPANVVRRIMRQSSPEMRIMINKILKYPDDSAGSVMTIEYVSLRENMTVAEAFQRIKKVGIDKETIYNCYVVDSGSKLLGLCTVKNLLLSDQNTLISDLMETNVVSVNTLTDKEEAAQTLGKYGFMALPVIDQEERLVGIITYDDAIEVIQDENEEDFLKLAGTSPTDTPYLKTSIWSLFKNRVPWLLILMISATFTGMIISNYETTLAVSITLTACIPMIMGTGGNAGSQASVTIIRSIALGEVEFKDALKVIWKELRVSLLLGITISVACFGKLLLIDKLHTMDNGMLIALVICLTMLATIILAKFVGCILPLLAKVCHLDPAVVANPFITTIVDVLSLLIYCFIAMQLLAGIA